MTKNILLAEDSSVVYEIVKLFLSKNGHTVTIVEDGHLALDALLRNDFDVALMDFHLPELNGVEVINRYMAAAVGRKLPRFVAMTADPSALLAADGDIDHFETVLPKPVDIDKLLEVIEREAPDRSQEPFPFVRPDRRSPKTDRRFSDSEHNLLYYPADFVADTFQSTRIKIDLQGPPDALIVTSFDDISDLFELNDQLALHMAPVIDLSSELAGLSDVSEVDTVVTDGHLSEIIEKTQALRNKVHPNLIASNTVRDRLLSQCYVRDQKLKTRLNSAYPQLTGYHVLTDPFNVERAARALVDNGSMTKSFRFRLHVCPLAKGHA